MSLLWGIQNFGMAALLGNIEMQVLKEELQIVLDRGLKRTKDRLVELRKMPDWFLVCILFSLITNIMAIDVSDMNYSTYLPASRRVKTGRPIVTMEKTRRGSWSEN